MSALGIDALIPQPKTRISPRVRVAVGLMVDQGRNRADAAKEAGLTDDALYRALQKSDVRSYRNHLMQVFRESAASRSLARVDKLADASTSESVKFESNKLLLALEDISPTIKSQSTIDHRGLQPGLVMNLIIGALQQPDALLIDGQTHEHGSQHIINGLPQPVPHPSMRNALPKPALPGDSQVPAKATGGAK